MIQINEKHEYLISELERLGVSIYKVDGEWVYNQSDEQLITDTLNNFDPLPASRKKAIERINEQSQTVMSAIESEYPSFEKLTWPTQKSEAESWDVYKAASTPTLDAIAAARGMDRDALIQKTLDKVRAFSQLAAQVAGKRQFYEDQIKESTDIEWLETVNFEL